MIQEHDIILQRDFISAAFVLNSAARDRLALIPREWFTDFSSREARDAILSDRTLDCLGYAHKLVAGGKYEQHSDAMAHFPAGMLNLPSHIDCATTQLRESFIRHKVECFADVVAKANGADLVADDRMNILEVGVNQIRQASESGEGNYGPISKGCMDAASELNDVQTDIRNNAQSKAIPTGIPSLDASLFGGGFHPGQTVFIGARPGVGKSSFMITVARNMALNQRPVGLISLEMTAKELAMIAAQQRARVGTNKFYREIASHAESQAMNTGFMEVGGLPIFIDDSSRLTVEQVAARIKLMARVDDCRCVFVDYAQKIAFSKGMGDTVEQLNHISAVLTETAKELQIIIVPLCQLNRGAAAGVAPELKDFKGSGNFEQDAHTALLLHRPNQAEKGHTETMQIIIAKQRRGPSPVHIDVNFYRPTQLIY